MKRKVLFVKCDIMRVKSRMCIKVIEFVSFMGVRVANEDTFGGMREKFVIMIVEGLCIRETHKHIKVVIVGCGIKKNLKM